MRLAFSQQQVEQNTCSVVIHYIIYLYMQTGDIYLSFYLHDGFITDLRLLKVDYNQQKNNYFLLLLILGIYRIH